MNEVIRRREWVELYSRLQELFAPLGKSDPFGNGDYWIMDDDWGGPWQKIYIFNLAILRSGILSNIYDLVMTQFANWDVAVALSEIPADQTLEGLIFSINNTGIHYEEIDLMKLPSNRRDISLWHDRK